MSTRKDSIMNDFKGEPDVIVIGGSIAGLMHALVLKSHGFNVRILEARSEDQMQAQAAGLTLWPNGQKLITEYATATSLDTIATRDTATQVMTADGVLLYEAPTPSELRTSSWATVHSSLKDACLKTAEGHGKVHFGFNEEVLQITEEGCTVNVVFRSVDVACGTTTTVSARLVIAADGSRSVARKTVCPGVEPEYAGYLAWRGSFPETEVPEQLQALLHGKFASSRLNSGYVFAYLTPDETGRMETGKRRVEWCWYDNCDYSSVEYRRFLTDSTGKEHNVTVPAHLLDPEVWKAQRARRDDLLSPLWKSVFSLSTTPLLTAIRSFDNDKALFMNGKLLLVGEAFTQIRPHLGASCDIAALSALSCVEYVRGSKTGEEWQKDVVTYAFQMATASRAMGVFGMTGAWPEGYQP